MKLRTRILLILFAGLYVFISCSKPYVGNDVSYDWKELCQIDADNECFTSTKHFDFYFTVRSVKQSDTYIMEGYAVYKGASVWTYIRQSIFILLPIRNGKVVDYITFSPISNILTEKIPIQKVFSSTGGIDAVIISYRLEVTDQDGPI